MVDELVDLLSQLDDVTKTYFDLLGTESESLIRENQIESVEKIKEYLKVLEDENRLLQIGIIGRVKAGKSSLINALLFDGKDILPKAATPMTAALTELSYGEALSAEVEFYTKDKVSMEVFEEFLNDCKGLSTLNSSSELKEDLRFKKWFDSDSYYFGHYRLNDKYDNWLYNDFDYDKTFDGQCPAKLKNFQVFYYDYLSTKYDVDVDFEK